LVIKVGRRGKEHVVAVRDAPFARREDGAVGVAVKGYAQVGAAGLRLPGHLLGVKRAAIQVDVAPVGLGIQDARLNLQLVEQRGHHVSRGAVSAIHHQPRRAMPPRFRRKAGEVVQVVLKESGGGL
jgi:hypothetical protein